MSFNFFGGGGGGGGDGVGFADSSCCLAIDMLDCAAPMSLSAAGAVATFEPKVYRRRQVNWKHLNSMGRARRTSNILQNTSFGKINIAGAVDAFLAFLCRTALPDVIS